MFSKTVFLDANEAFRNLYRHISSSGYSTAVGTKKVDNIGFYILKPLNRDISQTGRNWSKSYAEREWEWYLSRNRSVEWLKKFAPIWDKMHGGDNIVNSNYGFLWSEENQLGKTIQQLKDNPHTRQAAITIFDGKRKDEFKYDTPCTLSIVFTIEFNVLCMSVFMRSNDIWFGFCNDQYCFSKLQEMVAYELQIQVGWYYHHAVDMHIYNEFLNKDI